MRVAREFDGMAFAITPFLSSVFSVFLSASSHKCPIRHLTHEAVVSLAEG